MSTITCPRCGMTSAHPEDVRQGYCGNCHDWTSRCSECGTQLTEQEGGMCSRCYAIVTEPEQ